MNSILSKKTTNYLFIMNHLYINDVKLTFFITMFEATRLTVISTIESLNQIIKPSEIVSINDGFSLKIPHHDSFDYCVARILSESIELTVLEKIFFEEKHSYLTLSEELFISESTARRIISHLNKVLVSYSVSIQTRPLKIIGEERLIRLLFFRLFIEKYGLFNPPFKKHDIQYIRKFYQLKIPFLKREKNIQDEYNFILFSLTSFHRECLNHTINYHKKKSMVNLLVNILDKFPILGFGRTIKSELSESINSLSNVFYLYLSDDFLSETEISNSANKNTLLIEQFVNKIITEFKIEISNKTKHLLIRDIYDANFGFLALKNNWAKLSMNNNEYHNFYELNGELLDKDVFKRIFLETIGNKKIPYLPITYFFFYTRTYSENMRNMEVFKTIKLGIFVDYDKNYSEYLNNILTQNIPSGFELINLSDKHMIELPNELKDITYLITNSFQSFGFDTENIYRINHFSTKNELITIVSWLTEKRINLK